MISVEVHAAAHFLAGKHNDTNDYVGPGQVWDGEHLPLYRVLVAIVLAAAGPAFLLFSGMVWLMGLLFTPPRVPFRGKLRYVTRV